MKLTVYLKIRVMIPDRIPSQQTRPPLPPPDAHPRLPFPRNNPQSVTGSHRLHLGRIDARCDAEAFGVGFFCRPAGDERCVRGPLKGKPFGWGKAVFGRRLGIKRFDIHADGGPAEANQAMGKSPGEADVPALGMEDLGRAERASANDDLIRVQAREPRQQEL